MASGHRKLWYTEVGCFESHWAPAMVLIPQIHRGRTQGIVLHWQHLKFQRNCTKCSQLFWVQFRRRSKVCFAGQGHWGKFHYRWWQIRSSWFNRIYHHFPRSPPPPPKIKNSGHGGQCTARREPFLVFHGPDENVIRVISWVGQTGKLGEHTTGHCL